MKKLKFFGTFFLGLFVGIALIILVSFKSDSKSNTSSPQENGKANLELSDGSKLYHYFYGSGEKYMIVTNPKGGVAIEKL